jgi:PAS domain S-box-containing protein
MNPSHNSPIAQFTIGSDHRVLSWNRACEVLTGRPSAEMVGRFSQWEPFYAKKHTMLSDILLQNDKQEIKKLEDKNSIVRSRVTPNAFKQEAFFENVGGRPRLLLFIAATTSHNGGDISGATEYIIDITDLNHLETPLMESLAGYRLLAEQIPCGVLLTDYDVTVFCNQEWANIYGYKNPEELLSLPPYMYIAESHRDRFKEEVLERGKQRKWQKSVFQWPAKTKDGRDIWVEGRPKHVMWKNKPAVLTSVVDITKEKLQEKHLKGQTERLLRENTNLKSSIGDRFKFRDIVGKSSAMHQAYELILKAANVTDNVIITGESGTGKELVATAIHELSDRSDKRFVTVNSGAILETLLESEFFGYKKGAFTGATTDKAGFLDVANGGSLFLDEVGELPLNLQVKLLRVLDGGAYTPVGGTEEKKTNIRIIAATNRDLAAQVKTGQMREDFFYRLNVIPIQIPPLRDRKEDIPLLVDHFLHEKSEIRGLSNFPSQMLNALLAYNWPGNVRELQNVINRFIAIGDLTIGTMTLNQDLDTTQISDKIIKGERFDLKSHLDGIEKKVISDTLLKNGGNRTKTSELLGLSRKGLFIKMKRYELT